MKPTLATLIKEPFDSPDWIFEEKFDGIRALAHLKDKVKLLSRNNLPLNKKFPQIVEELNKIKIDCVLDGEIVIFDKKRRSHFQLLQNYQKSQKGTPYYYLFDILFYQGKDLRKLPCIERRSILKSLLKKYKLSHVKFSKSVDKKGKDFFKKAKKRGWEGIIAKRKLSPYPSKRTREWLKIKVQKEKKMIIGGFTKPKGSRKYFGSLLVGFYKDGKLKYAGRVGTGFDQNRLKELYTKMKKWLSPHCPFSKEPKLQGPIFWIKPKLACKVSFTEWTNAKQLRHPVFQGLLPVKKSQSK
jgi:bifunctional non-homologous end joining protein LigD